MASADAMSGRIWIKDEEHAWLLASVRESGARGSLTVAVDLDGSVRKVSAADTKPVNATHLADPIWDIAQVSEMSEAPLIDVLRRRFVECKIYTMVSDILIAINPYYLIPGLYDIKPGVPFTLGETPPHIYTTADTMYRLMIADGRLADQAVLVSGESGAGKTEACKSIMNYLAQLSKKVAADRARRGSAVDLAATSTIETKVLACNPFLEAFGNAKTCRNDNSSRFGKFLKIHYTRGTIVGAAMEQYLLEKGRLTEQGPGERNYHIYYQICQGLSGEEKRKLGLKSAKEYTILTRGGRDSVKCARIDDGAEFADAREAMLEVGIERDAEQWSIFKVLTALLELGNLKWAAINVTEGERSHGANRIAHVKNQDAVLLAAKHLGVPMLEESLAIRILPKSGSICQAPLTAEKAHDATEALIKFTYKKVFAWLVDRINVLLKPEGKTESYIGILDIFGFEIFEQNSFEQLCINYTNEKLQALFNHHVFELEQVTYVEEGIDVKKIKFKDNKHCLLLVEGKTKGFVGILPRLDDRSKSERVTDTDDALANELAFFFKSDRNHRKRLEKELGSMKKGAANIRKYVNASQYIDFPKVPPNDWFAIHHFAGPVTYAIDGFLEKNKDRLYPHLQAVMGASSDPFVANLYRTRGSAKSESASGGGGRRTRKRAVSGGAGDGVNTIAGRFISQLGALVDTVEKTNQHYVRCIKPNSEKLKCTRGIDAFEAQKCRQQLLYAGVMETIKIRKQGYPVRELYHDFWAKALKYKWNIFANVPDGVSPKEGTIAVVTAAVGTEDDSGMWLVGNTMLFGKDGLMEEITRWHRAHVIKTIQNFARSRNVRVAMIRRRQERMARLYAHLKSSIKVIEALTLGAIAKAEIDHLRGRAARERAAREKIRLAEEAERLRLERERLAGLQQQAVENAVTIARLAAVAAYTAAATTMDELAGLLANEAARKALLVARAAAKEAARQERRAAIVEEFASKIKEQMLGAADALADRARQFAANQREANQSSKSLLYQQIEGLSATVSTFASERNTFDAMAPGIPGMSGIGSYGSSPASSPYSSGGQGVLSPSRRGVSPSRYASPSAYAPSPSARSPYAARVGSPTAGLSSPQLYRSIGSPMRSTAGSQYDAHQLAAANAAYQQPSSRSISPSRRSPGAPSSASSYFNLVPGASGASRSGGPEYSARSSPSAANRADATAAARSKYVDLVSSSPGPMSGAVGASFASGVVSMVLEATAGQERQVHVSRRGSVDVSLSAPSIH